MKHHWLRCIAVTLCTALLGGGWTITAGAESATGRYVIACVGDSITEGIGSTNSALYSYPAQLQKQLGDAYEVVNCGAGGTTLLKDNNAPCYRRQSRFSESRKCNPDMVIIMLGTNDSKPAHWVYKDNYVTQLVDLIELYQGLESHPTVYVGTSATVVKSLDGITDAVVTNEVVPLQKQAAKQAGCEVIDINAATKGHEDWSLDGVHMSNDGYAKLAGIFADFLSPRYDPRIVETVTKRLDALPSTPGAAYAEEVAAIRYAFDRFSERQAKLVTAEQQKKLTAAEQSVQQTAATTAPLSPTTASEASASGSSQTQDSTQTTQTIPSPSADSTTTFAQTALGDTEPVASSYRWLFWFIPLVVLLAGGAAGILVFLKRGKKSLS